MTPHAAALSFDGTAAIDLEVTKPTTSLVLNAADLTFAKAAISGRGGAQVAATVSTDDKAQTATFDFGRTIAPGSYTLAIDYAGKINTQANGLFALDYKNPSGGAEARDLHPVRAVRRAPLVPELG